MERRKEAGGGKETGEGADQPGAGSESLGRLRIGLVFPPVSLSVSTIILFFLK
jgi:hypothetical protein